MATLSKSETTTSAPGADKSVENLQTSSSFAASERQQVDAVVFPTSMASSISSVGNTAVVDSHVVITPACFSVAPSIEPLSHQKDLVSSVEMPAPSFSTENTKPPSPSVKVADAISKSTSSGPELTSVTMPSKISIPTTLSPAKQSMPTVAVLPEIDSSFARAVSEISEAASAPAATGLPVTSSSVITPICGSLPTLEPSELSSSVFPVKEASTAARILTIGVSSASASTVASDAAVAVSSNLPASLETSQSIGHNHKKNEENVSIVDGKAVPAEGQVTTVVATEAGATSSIGPENFTGERKNTEDGTNDMTIEKPLGPGAALIGRKVRKRFQKKHFYGQIIDFDGDQRWYKVRYNDGDEEELEWGEIESILISSRGKAQSKPAEKKRSASPELLDEDSKRDSKRATRSSARSSLSNAEEQEGLGAQSEEKTSPTEIHKQNGDGKVSESNANEPQAEELDGMLQGKDGASEPNISMPSEPKSRSRDRKRRRRSDSFSRSGRRRNRNRNSETHRSDADGSPVHEKRSHKKKKVDDEEIDMATTVENRVTRSATGSLGPLGTLESPGPLETSGPPGTPGLAGPPSGPLGPLAPPGPIEHMEPLVTPIPLRPPETLEPIVPKEISVDVENTALAQKVEEQPHEKNQDDSVKLQVSSGGGGAKIIGRKTCKEFAGQFYRGEVVGYDSTLGYYKVKYEDSDEEELDWSELKPTLISQEENCSDSEGPVPSSGKSLDKIPGSHTLKDKEKSVVLYDETEASRDQLGSSRRKRKSRTVSVSVMMKENQGWDAASEMPGSFSFRTAPPALAAVRFASASDADIFEYYGWGEVVGFERGKSPELRATRLLPTASPIVHLAASQHHLAVMTATGQVWVWRNKHGNIHTRCNEWEHVASLEEKDVILVDIAGPDLDRRSAGYRIEQEDQVPDPFFLVAVRSDGTDIILQGSQAHDPVQIDQAEERRYPGLNKLLEETTGGPVESVGRIVQVSVGTVEAPDESPFVGYITDTDRVYIRSATRDFMEEVNLVTGYTGKPLKIQCGRVYHAILMTDDGRAWTWGSGYYPGSNTVSSGLSAKWSPFSLCQPAVGTLVGRKVVDVGCYGEDFVALTNDGDVHQWTHAVPNPAAGVYNVPATPIYGQGPCMPSGDKLKQVSIGAGMCAGVTEQGKFHTWRNAMKGGFVGITAAERDIATPLGWDEKYKETIISSLGSRVATKVMCVAGSLIVIVRRKSKSRRGGKRRNDSSAKAKASQDKVAAG